MFLALPADLTAIAGPTLRLPINADAEAFRAVLASLRQAAPVAGDDLAATDGDESTLLAGQDDTGDATPENLSPDEDRSKPVLESAGDEAIVSAAPDTVSTEGNAAQHETLPDAPLPAVKAEQVTIGVAVEEEPAAMALPDAPQPAVMAEPVAPGFAVVEESAPMAVPDVPQPAVKAEPVAPGFAVEEEPAAAAVPAAGAAAATHPRDTAVAKSDTPAPFITQTQHSEPVFTAPPAPETPVPAVINTDSSPDSGLAALAQLPERAAPVQEVAVAVLANPRAALWQGRLSLGAMQTANPKPDRISQLTQVITPALAEGKAPVEPTAPAPHPAPLLASPNGTQPAPDSQKASVPPLDLARTQPPEAPIAQPLARVKPAAPVQGSKAAPDLLPIDRITLPSKPPAAQMAPPAQRTAPPMAPLDAATPEPAAIVEGAQASIAAPEGRSTIPPGFVAATIAPLAADPVPQISHSAQPVPAKATEVVQNIAQQMSAQISNSGSDGFEVALAPDELGAVRLRLHSSDAGSVLIVQAERPETVDLMRRHIATLEHELRSLGHDALTVRFAGNPSGGGSANPQDGGSQDGSAQTNSPDDPVETTDHPRQSPQRISVSDHLDLRL